MGGYSSEREISLKSGRNVSQALKDSGCRVSDIDIQCKENDKIFDLIKESKIDVAFIALHGALGEDGTIQTILERAQIPYTGSGVEASQLVMNKVLTQKILKENKIPIPDYEVITDNKDLDIDIISSNFKKLPVVVKPACEGSSLGISIVHQKDELRPAIQKAFDFGTEVMLEEYIKGKELTVGILEQKPLPIIEIRPNNIFFDFTAKYQRGMTEYIVPAELNQDLAMNIQHLATEVHLLLGCLDFSRVDIMLNDQDEPCVFEVNTIPGFTSTSLVPMAAKHNGINFSNLCLKLIDLAYEKKK